MILPCILVTRKRHVLSSKERLLFTKGCFADDDDDDDDDDDRIVRYFLISSFLIWSNLVQRLIAPNMMGFFVIFYLCLFSTCPRFYFRTANVMMLLLLPIVNNGFTTKPLAFLKQIDKIDKLRTSADSLTVKCFPQPGPNTHPGFLPYYNPPPPASSLTSSLNRLYVNNILKSTFLFQFLLVTTSEPG
jgi:hypothetical protein